MPLPKIQIEGALTADPELRFTPAGKGWASCRLVAKDRVKGADGQWTDGPPLFIDVVVFGKPAENLVESAGRGDTVVVTGKLQPNDYEKKDGTKVQSYRIVAESVGVSLLWNPAKTEKVAGGGGDRPVASGGDPWGGAWGGDQPDEPPF